MDEKDKELQELRRKINRLEGKDLTPDEKVERVREFIEWAIANISQHDTAMVDGCGIVLAVVKDEHMTSFVSGDGESCMVMITMIGDSVYAKLEGAMENYECTLS